MELRIRLFAGARERVGCETIEVETSGPMEVGALRAELSRRYPQLTELLARSRIAVDNRFVNDKHDLTPNAEVAVIPPVSGG